MGLHIQMGWGTSYTIHINKFCWCLQLSIKHSSPYIMAAKTSGIDTKEEITSPSTYVYVHV